MHKLRSCTLAKQWHLNLNVYLFRIYRALTGTTTNATALNMQLLVKEEAFEVKTTLTLPWLKSRHLPIDSSKGRMNYIRDLPQLFSPAKKVQRNHFQTHQKLHVFNTVVATFNIIFPKIKEQCECNHTQTKRKWANTCLESCLENRVKAIMTKTSNKAPDRPWHQVPTDLFYTRGGTHVVVADTATSLGGSSWCHLHKLDTCHPETKPSICKTWDAQLASFQMGGFPVDSTTDSAATESALLQQCIKFSS